MNLKTLKKLQEDKNLQASSIKSQEDEIFIFTRASFASMYNVCLETASDLMKRADAIVEKNKFNKKYKTFKIKRSNLVELEDYLVSDTFKEIQERSSRLKKKKK